MSETDEIYDDEPTTLQRLSAEAIGTFVVVLFGASAVVLSRAPEAPTGSPLVAALAFGLGVAVMGYAFGRVTGGHFNPAVTLGAALGGRMAWRQTPVYLGAQLLGGVLAGAVLLGLLHGFEGFDAEGNLAQNGFGDQGTGYAWWAALLVELVMAAVLVWVFLAVTDARNDYQVTSVPLAYGLAYAVLTLGSFTLTGAGLNPARSIGVGLFAGTDAIVQLWLFVLAPLLGAALAGLTYPLLFGHGSEPVAGSGLSFGGGSGRRRGGHDPQQYGQPGYPGGYDQYDQWGQQPQQPQQWGQPAQGGWGAQPGPDETQVPSHWGQPAQQPAQPAQQQWSQPPAQGQPGGGQYYGQQPPAAPYGQPAQQPAQQQPGYPQSGTPEQPQTGSQPSRWGPPADDDEDGRTQIRRND